MPNGVSTRAAPADPKTLEVVRPEIRKLLLSVPAYKQLSPEEQQKIASAMVKIASYMANPSGVLTQPLASAQADAAEATKQRLSKAPGQVGQDFKAGAVEQGVEQFGELVKKVDFPKFVGGLIKNVFQAIVESSIEQMRAYGELVANVAKTVDEFARDNISENNARDWLAGKYPDAFDISFDTESSGMAEGSEAPPAQPQARIQTKENVTDQRLKEVSTDMGIDKPVTDLSNEDEEARLVQAARLQMA